MKIFILCLLFAFASAGFAPLAPLSFSCDFVNRECFSTGGITGGSTGIFPTVRNVPQEKGTDPDCTSDSDIVVKGKMAYSALAHKLLVKGKVDGESFSIVYDYTKGVKYNTTNGDCECQVIKPDDENDPFGREPVFFLPKDSGGGSSTTITVNSATITVTPYQQSFSYGGLTYASTLYYNTIAANDYVARFSASFDISGVSYIENSDFYNVDTDEPNADNFEPKCGCKKEKPAPESAPAHDCPSPASDCQCVSLSFCDMVDYPIDGLLPAADADAGAQATYDGVVASSSLSAACKTALKNFICVSVFLRCDTGRVFYSPCRQMCVDCSCTDGPVGAFSCSFYTDKDTCVSIGKDQDTSCLKDREDSESGLSSTLAVSFAFLLSAFFLAIQF